MNVRCALRGHQWVRPYRLSSSTDDFDKQPINWLKEIPNFYGIRVGLVSYERKCLRCGKLEEKVK